MTWFKMFMRTKIVFPLKSFRYKRINDLIFSNLWNNFTKFHLCFDSTVHNRISIYSNLDCYSFWLTTEILYLPLSKKQTNSIWTSVILSWWFYWFFLKEGKRILINFRKHINIQRSQVFPVRLVPSRPQSAKHRTSPIWNPLHLNLY